MPDIDMLLVMLESSDSSVRYDACEQLRVASSIPDRAISSLENTLRDPDELVADAARRALALHKPEPMGDTEGQDRDLEEETTEGKGRSIGRTIGCGVLVMILVLACLALLPIAFLMILQNAGWMPW